MAILDSVTGGSTDTSDIGDTTEPTATPDAGGYVPAPEPTTYDDPDPAPTGGEHTYDVDPSVNEDPALDYTSVNDPRQTAEDTTGTAGGQTATDLATGWSGGIAYGLDEVGAPNLPGSPTETITAISDATHKMVAGVKRHTTTIAQQDGENMGLPDLPDYNGGPVINMPTMPEFPSIPKPEVDVTIPGAKALALAVVASAAFLVFGRKSSGA